MDSLGDLIDKLSIVNIKIFHLVDIVETVTDDKTVADAARKSQQLNRRRSQLINEINERLGNDDMIVKM